MTMPEIGASVTVATDAVVDLSLVEQRTGLPTTASMLAGQTRESPGGHRWPNPSPRSLWQYRVPSRSTVDLQGVVLEVLEALEPVRSEFVGLIDGLDLDAWLSVHVHQFDETPDGTLSTDVLARLVALRLDLDLDLYLDGPASGEGPGS